VVIGFFSAAEHSDEPEGPAKSSWSAISRSSLPEGVSTLDWGARTRQRPRIPRIPFPSWARSGLIEGVLESNYAPAFNCSPETPAGHLEARLRQVLAADPPPSSPPLLSVSSLHSPRLEDARLGAGHGPSPCLEKTRAAGARPVSLTTWAPDQLMEVRKLLCVSIGQIHAFLHDTFGAVMAADPREPARRRLLSLSRRFPREHRGGGVASLHAHPLEATIWKGWRRRAPRLPVRKTRPRARPAGRGGFPRARTGSPPPNSLRTLLTGLTPKLKEISRPAGNPFL